MQKLYNKLKQYDLLDAIKIEESDRQFIALKRLSENIEDKELYLSLIILNSLVCYQLSWKGEEYWEEFSEYFSKQNICRENVIENIKIFLDKTKYNKRFTNIKKQRLNKLDNFVLNFYWKSEYYYSNMVNLRDELSKEMNQNINAKTIVFAIKMFSYWARNIYEFIIFPKWIFLPIDSRLKQVFELYKCNYTSIDEFYIDLSKKLNIPMLHLDWIVWTLYQELLKN